MCCVSGCDERLRERLGERLGERLDERSFVRLGKLKFGLDIGRGCLRG